MSKTDKEPEAFTSVPPAEIPGRAVTSSPEHEFIGSSVEYAYWNVNRVLPQEVDDAERLYGVDLYERMNNDPILAGIEKVMKTVVLADGISVLPSDPQPARGAANGQVAEYQQSQFYADYVSYCVSRLEEFDEPIEYTLQNLLDGPRLGHKLAEVTYDWLPDGRFEGKAGIASISCKPRRNYAFAVSPMNKLVGVMAIVPGVSPLIWRGIVGDPSLFPNCVAPEKILIFSAERRDGNPNGVSWYRSCYDPWQRKQSQKKNSVNAGTQTGGGLVTAIAPKVHSGETFQDPVSGKQITLTQAIFGALTHLGSGRPGVFPYETQIQVHQPANANNYFDWFFGYCDREMVTAFLLSSRSVLEAEHSSKADGDNALDLLDELKMFLRQRLCLTLNALGRRLLRLSFGESVARRFSPRFSMQKTSRPDLASLMTSTGQLFTGLSGAGVSLARNQQAYFLQEILGAPAADGSEEAAAERRSS